MSRRVLVTGAAGGLAAGIAPLLASDGFAHVAITFHTHSPDATLAAIRATGCSASAAQIDFLAEPMAIARELDDLIARDGPFDTLVHAVGPFVVKRFARLDVADYTAMFDGNVRSTILATAAVLPAMRRAGFGRIVVFGALGAAVTQPFRGLSFYQAAKSALIAFARTLALEEARSGVTVNVVVPGDIREKSLDRDAARAMVGRTPCGRPGSFEDLADTVRFLIARERDFMTGAIVDVTGGATEADGRNQRL